MFNPAYCFEEWLTASCPWEEGCALEIPEETAISKGNLVDTISMTKEFKISFKMKATTTPDVHVLYSVIHFTTFDGSAQIWPAQPGSRNPAIWIYRGTPSIAFYDSKGHMKNNHRDMHNEVNLPFITAGEWFNFEISQTFDEDRDTFVFRTEINGKPVDEREVQDAADYDAVNVFIGHPKYEPQDGFIKELFVSN